MVDLSNQECAERQLEKMPAMTRIARLLARLRSGVGRVLADRRGGAAVFLVVALVPLVGTVGLAVDSSVGYLLRSRLSKSLDAAGLAAGRAAFDSNSEALARSYFDANFGAGSAAAVTGFTFTVDSTMHFARLTAQAETSTYFMKIFGQEKMVVSASTEIERETTGMELALVLDNTGSMAGSKFTTMRNAALDLVGTLYGTDSTIENLWVSVVPFVTSVNIGTANKAWIKATDPARSTPATSWSKTGSTSVVWAGCVKARANPLDTSETPPSGGLFSSYRWEGSLPKGFTDLNLDCPAEILPLTDTRSTVDAALNKMAVAPGYSGTATNFGLVWGWRTLSPLWRGLWSGSAAKLPLDYDTDMMKKVVVVLTDGENQLLYNQYGGFGLPSSQGFTATEQSTPVLNTRMQTICDAMEAKNIQIFTIMFGMVDTPKSKVAKKLLEDCKSSDGMFFDAVTNADLVKAFKTIGGQLANLRIVK